ncbi:MAG: right-handed parallel beta-helix repeat-containing protein [Bacteroidetes bacterium]|nr:right-handed parallel beta-helix repeat-containing protein [Bacteroidota bacterium]
MHKQLIVLLLTAILTIPSTAQTLFVDPSIGHDNAKGTIDDPLASLGKAIALTNGTGNRTIKLAPGLYTLDDQLVLGPSTDTLTIEAAVNPDDPAWLPSKMPVIAPISHNTQNWGKFDHCTGFQIERDNVQIRGLKFVGNANPAVVYYYAIERHSPDLKGLRISQCIFAGSRNAAPIQGAVFAQGPGITIDHCIFYECKNALLLFVSITGFSLTNSILYGSYEGAIWFGKYSDFVFRDNIIANNNCFWVNMPGYAPQYTFNSSLITGNTIYMGLNVHGKVGPGNGYLPATNNVRRTGKVVLNLVDTDTIPRLYLHPSPISAGRQIPAGIFTH